MTLTQISIKTKLSKQTVYNYVEMLVTLGLIFERREKGIPPKRFIWLSENGKKAAQILYSIEAHHLSRVENKHNRIKKLFSLMIASQY